LGILAPESMGSALETWSDDEWDVGGDLNQDFKARRFADNNPKWLICNIYTTLIEEIQKVEK
jgi:hypothetical protein